MTRTPHAIAGRRVLLTRAADDAGAWAERLTALGAEALVRPCIRTEAIDSPALREAVHAGAEAADWWVFTSRRGVEAFMRLAPGAAPGHARVAVVGTATGAAAEAALGRPPEVIGPAGTAESLAEALLAEPVTGARFMLALAHNAGRVLERALDGAGAHCRRFDVYRTVPAVRAAAREPLSSLRVDAVWLASPSSVEGFMNQFEPDDAGVRLVAIGPSTASAMRRHGLNVHAVAALPEFDALLEATSA